MSLMHPLGYRKPREQMSTTIPEDALLHESTADESPEEEESQHEHDVGYSRTPSVLSPAPVARVVVQEDEDDQLGMDDDEPAYYDSEE